ncbi:MAG: hypothetical protein EZS28_053189, partial [Streblomastix strix]
DKVDLRLQPKTKSGLRSHKLPKTKDRTIISMEHYVGMKTKLYQPKVAKSHSDQRNYQT